MVVKLISCFLISLFLRWCYSLDNVENEYELLFDVVWNKESFLDDNLRVENLKFDFVCNGI